MADKTIGDLPFLDDVTDSTLMPVEETGVAYHTTGEAWKAFVRAAIAAEVAAVLSAASRADDDAVRAETAAADAAADRTAIEGMDVSSIVLPAGDTPTLTKTESGGVWNLIFGLVPGPKGDPGQNGQTGPQGEEGPPGPPSSAGAVQAAEGVFAFSIGNSTEQATLGEAGHLLLTYAGNETSEDQWYIDWDENSPTWGHLFYDTGE